MTIVETGAKRGRPPAFDRREVLERAMITFWAHGYDGASMPLLTGAMGISAQSLYAAFGSKEALYREAIDLYRATGGAFVAHALDGEADAVAALVRLLRDAADLFAGPVGAPGCMITTAPSGIADEPLIEYGRALRGEGTALVAARIERGQREGQVRSGADGVSWARFINALVQGMSVQARDGATVADLQTIAVVGAQALEQLRPER